MLIFSVAVTFPVTLPITLTTLAIPDLGLDPTVGADSNRVLVHLDLAFDLALYGHVFLGAQVALDLHRLPDCGSLSHWVLPPLWIAWVV